MRPSNISRIFDIKSVPPNSKVWIRGVDVKNEGLAFMNDLGPVFSFKDRDVGGEELVRLGWKYIGHDDRGIAEYSSPGAVESKPKGLPLP